MKINKLATTFLISIFTIPVIVSTQSSTFMNANNLVNSNQKSINNESNDTLNNTNVWEQTIKDSSNNTNVKVFFSNTATAVFQEFLVTINYMLQSNQKRTGSDEIVWFLDAQIYDPKKYNFDYYISNYGPSSNGQASDYNFALWSRIAGGGVLMNQLEIKMMIIFLDPLVIK